MGALDFVLPGTSIAKIEYTILSNFYDELTQKFTAVHHQLLSEALLNAKQQLHSMDYALGKVEKSEMPHLHPLKMTSPILELLATAERQYSYHKKGTYP